MNIANRYIDKLHQLNSARIVPDQCLMSPEAFYDFQSETVNQIGSSLYFEMQNFGTGLKDTLFGIPVTIDPDLKGNEVYLEIAI